MKVALFLYPITPYLDALHIFDCSLDKRLKERSRTLKRVLEQRYRQRGWRIVWVMFSRDGEPLKPDTDLLSPHFDLRPEDALAVVPISFKRHCAEKKYPDAEQLVRSLGPVSRLAVCGFHCDDCVEKVAEAAYRLGIKAKVHDDLTEHFFLFDFMRRRQDAIRARPAWLRIAGLSDENAFGSRSFRRRMTPVLRRERKKRPWLLQF